MLLDMCNPVDCGVYNKGGKLARGLLSETNSEVVHGRYNVASVQNNTIVLPPDMNVHISTPVHDGANNIFSTTIDSTNTLVSNGRHENSNLQNNIYVCTGVCTKF